MPVLFTMHRDEGYFVSHYIASVDGDELRQSYAEFKEIQQPDGLNELVDLSQADLSPLSSESLDTHSIESNARNEKRETPKLTAIFAPTDLTSGLAHMFAVGVDESLHVVQIFRDWDEAVDWLTEDLTAEDESVTVAH